MKFRITGSITNLDAAAHRPVLRIRGFNHVGAVGEKPCDDKVHRLPILVSMQLWSASGDWYSGLPTGVSLPIDRTFDMDEVESVSLDIQEFYDCSYVVDLAEDPADPVVT